MIPAQSEPSGGQQRARDKAQLLATAFEVVFGQPRKRTASQQLVLEHLAQQAGEDSPSYQFNTHRDGLSIIAAGIHRDGAKLMLLVVDRQLAIALKNRQPRAAKPKAIVK